MLSEDRSVLDLLTADYTFLNERLARHYGIPNVYGSHFRRVALSDENRKGLLGQGSILTVTSYATRTAPTIRGKWLLENILGTPPPPPPPNVPSLALKTGSDGKLLTMRQQMEQHRANPACASCHKVMDPLGFALENFDAIGKWRSMDGSSKIDAIRRHARRFPPQGPRGFARLFDVPPRSVRHHGHGKASYLCSGPRRRRVRLSRHSQDRAGRRPAITAGRRWWSAIAKSTPFQMRRSGSHDDHHAKGASPPHRFARARYDSGAAAAGRHGAGARRGQTAAKAPTRLSIVYLPNGIMMDQWTPDAEGAGFKLKPILEPLAPFRDRMLILSGFPTTPAAAPARRKHRRPCPRRRQLSLRRASEEDRRRRHRGRRFHGPDRRQARSARRPSSPRSNCAWTPGAARPVRSRLFLRLHELHLLAHADDAHADGRPAARRLRAPVRRYREHRSRRAPSPHQAGPQHSRLRRQEGDAAEGRTRSIRSVEAHRISRRHSRCRAPHPDGRGAIRPRAAEARAPRRRSGDLHRARQADVRFAGAGLPDRSDARHHLHDGTRIRRPHLSRDRHSRKATTR